MDDPEQLLKKIWTDTIRGIFDEDEVATMNPNSIGVASGGRAPLIISESGLYALVFRSRKLEARAFSKGVNLFHSPPFFGGER